MPNNVETECVYCGSTESMTVDHVPPRSLFPRPRPSNLITVPCCRSCNKGWSTDDEYLRTVLVFRSDVGDQEAGSRVAPTAVRSFQREEGVGFRTAFAATIRPVEIVTPTGLYVGNSATYDVDGIRLARSGERITKGLYYHEFRRRLPETVSVRSYPTDALESMEVEARESLMRMADDVFRTQTIRRVGDGVFAYTFGAARDRPEAMLWIMQFYDRVPFISLTIPSDLQRPSN